MKTFNPDGSPVTTGAGWSTGILMRIAPADPSYFIELQRAVTASSAISHSNQITGSAWNPIAVLSPDNIDMAGTPYVDRVPNINGTTYYYRVRHTYPNFSESVWLYSGNALTPHDINDASVNNYWKSQAAYAAVTDDSTGQLLNVNVLASDSVSSMKLTKGTQVGTSVHAGTVTFNPPFANNPLVVIQGGLSVQPEAKWSSDLTKVSASTATGTPSSSLAQRSIYEADALSTSGFTMKALLVQTGAQIYTSESMSSDQVTLTYASTDGYYTSYYHLNLDYTTKLTGPWSAIFTIATDVSYDGSNWFERGTQDVGFDDLEIGTHTVSVNGSLTIFDSAVTAADYIRSRVKSYITTGAYTNFSSSFVGDQVKYYRGGASSYASKTPNGTSATVQWSAYGYV